MNRKIFLQILLFLLVVGIASGAEFHGGFNIDTGGNNVVITPDTCQEDWSSSYWSECVNGEQTFVCIDSNSCGTTEVIPENCGLIQNCTIPNQDNNNNNGGGSNGGGGSQNDDDGLIILSNNDNSQEECVENWACFGWSNSEDQCGTRDCNDLDECGTEELKPTTKRDCPVTEQKGFFSSIFGPTGFAVALDSGSGVGALLILIIIAIAVLVVKRRSYKKVDSTKQNLE